MPSIRFSAAVAWSMIIGSCVTRNTPAFFHRLDVDIGDRRAVQEDRAAGGHALSGDQADQRGLAGAVLAQQAMDGAAADRERHVAQRNGGAIALGEVLDPEDERILARLRGG